AARACLDAPTRWAALTGVVALAGLLAVLVTPVAVPILAGYTLAALHAVANRQPVGAAGTSRRGGRAAGRPVAVDPAGRRSVPAHPELP
ncbi:hypothetical protein AB0J89_22710, partial [Micromonospora chokoriensis]